MEKIKDYLKKIYKSFYIYFIKKIYIWFCLVGIGICVLSFFAKNNWSSIFCNLGAGLIVTSIFAAFIDYINEKNYKRTLKEQQKTCFSFINSDIFMVLSIYLNLYKYIKLIKTDKKTKRSFNYEELKTKKNYINNYLKSTLNNTSNSLDYSIKHIEDSIIFFSSNFHSLYSDLKNLIKEKNSLTVHNILHAKDYKILIKFYNTNFIFDEEKKIDILNNSDLIFKSLDSLLNIEALSELKKTRFF